MPTKKEVDLDVDVKEEKKKQKKTGVIITILFVILILGAFVIALNNVGLLKIDGLKRITKPKVELTTQSMDYSESLIIEWH